MVNKIIFLNAKVNAKIAKLIAGSSKMNRSVME